MEGVPPTLPLAVLELLAGAGLAVLLALAREPVANGAGLAGRAAALDGDEYVELADGVRDRQRLRDDHPQRLTREVILECAAVDDDASGAGLDPHARHRGLAPPGAVEPVEHSRHLSTLLRRT